jgi:xanthine dehydrogenase/oxidase
MHVALALGLPAHKVFAKTKRLGGGFGGKETRAVNVSCAAAVPAYHLRRPVRLILDRDEDMHTSGHRHAFVGKYKVLPVLVYHRTSQNPTLPAHALQTTHLWAALDCEVLVCFGVPHSHSALQVGCTAEGKLVALQVDLYSNAGNSLDLSASIMDRALLHIDCVYRFPNVRAVGYICRTNHASNTAFRGFGGPQVPPPPGHRSHDALAMHVYKATSQSFLAAGHVAAWWLFIGNPEAG